MDDAAGCLAAAKAKSGGLLYSSAGIGQTDQMAMELFADMAGIHMTHVPYKGGPPALQGVMNHEPLALIEYWAIDPDYDGLIFRSVWQDYRGNIDNDDDPLRVVTAANLDLPRKEGPRTVCVRAVDVFGFESEVLIPNVEVSE